VNERLIAIYGRTMDFLRRRKQGYQLCFGGPGGLTVMADLMKFCRAQDSTFASNPRDHARLEGRREVWLRIQQHMNLPSDQLYALYGGRPINTTEDTDG
jgi:hypothetical protein